MSNESSVEWLQWALEHTILTHEQTMQTIGLFEQAKAMHRTEHLNTWLHCLTENDPITFDEYYNETFNTK